MQHFQCRTIGRSVTSPKKHKSLSNKYLSRFVAGRSLAKMRLAKTLAKSGSVPVVYRTLNYGILARAGLVLDSSQSGQR
jgi:hypothetical protein